jgi:hypothetical protein
MEPERKQNYDIEPDIRPNLRVINGGGETTPERGNLSAVPNNTSQELADAEQRGSSSDLPSNVTPIDVRRREAEGDKVAGDNDSIRSTFTGKNKKDKNSKVKLWRRAGIFGGGIGLIGVVFALLAGILPIGGILLNLGEVATANRDTQNTVLTKRLYKVIDAKMTSDVTNGSCSTVKIACRFSRPSNAFLSRIDDYGIKAFAGNDPIEKTALGFPNKQPTRYEFTKSDGTKLSVAPKDFVRTLQNDIEFRKAFTSAYNMRYWGYADSYIKNLFYKKNNIDRSGKATSEVDSKDPQKTVKTIADNAETDNKVKSATTDAEKTASAQSTIDDAVEKEVQQATKRFAKSGADPAILTGTIACTAINAPGFFTKVARLYQMRQEIALASTLVLTASSMVKTGDISPETMAAIGTLLTATYVTSGGTKSTSAMDSFGIKNVLFNDSGSSSSSYKKFIPGYAALTATKGVTEFAQSPAVKSTCDTLYSPETQIAATTIEAGIGAATGGIGAVAIAVLKAGGTGLITVLGANAIAGFVADGVKAMFSLISPDVIASILGNSDISNAKGEDLGNVLGSGINYFYSDAALSTGSAPLTTSQLASYNKVSQDTMIAYAQQDRAGRSPLDISSPYTFLGSIFANYYQHAYVPNNTIQTILSTVGYTLAAPFKMLTTNTYAAADDLSARCGYANEFGVDSSVAVGAFGDICAGIPAQYLDTPTTDVVGSVSGQIDENTGQPTSDGDIQTMLDMCSDGDLLTAKGCTINSQDRADQSLYMYDLRINDMLDGTNTDQSSDGGGAAASTSVDDANLFNDSTTVACAAGTQDAGTDTGYNHGTAIPIRLCSLPNAYLNEKNNSPALVNSRASGVALAMFNQMKTDLHISSVSLNDSFRTMAEQQAEFAKYGSPQAAQPGYSNHQMGYAFDVNMGSANGGNSSGYSAGVNTSYPGNPVWEWLKAHASQYHFSQLSSEGWHWSINGG